MDSSKTGLFHIITRYGFQHFLNNYSHVILIQIIIAVFTNGQDNLIKLKVQNKKNLHAHKKESLRKNPYNKNISMSKL